MAKKVDTLKEAPLATMLKTVGMTLLSSVGGAPGPLCGTFFLKAAQAVGDTAPMIARKGRANYLGPEASVMSIPGQRCL